MSAAEKGQNKMARLIQENILSPAGLNRTMSSQWQRKKSDVFLTWSKGMSIKNGEYIRRMRPERHLAGGIGIVSTVDDLAKYDIALDTG